MNPPPPPIPVADPRGAAPGICATTLLAVPECSCQNCLTQLMLAHAPALLAPDAS